jgi:hypothetical protein
MKSFFILMICFAWLMPAVCVTAAEPESKILGEATNKAGDKVVVREIIVAKKVADNSEHSGMHCYRFEFYSLGFLQSCSTRWDYEPQSVTVRWTSDTKCHVSMLNNWLIADFDAEAFMQYHGSDWTFARRID